MNRRPSSMVKTLVTRADGPGYWDGWPVGPESQAVSSLFTHCPSFGKSVHDAATDVAESQSLHSSITRKNTEILHHVALSNWSLSPGHWSLVIGHCSLVIGHWSLVIQNWSFSPCTLPYPFTFKWPPPELGSHQSMWCGLCTSRHRKHGRRTFNLR